MTGKAGNTDLMAAKCGDADLIATKFPNADLMAAKCTNAYLMAAKWVCICLPFLLKFWNAGWKKILSVFSGFRGLV